MSGNNLLLITQFDRFVCRDWCCVGILLRDVSIWCYLRQIWGV